MPEMSRISSSDETPSTWDSRNPARWSSVSQRSCSCPVALDFPEGAYLKGLVCLKRT